MTGKTGFSTMTRSVTVATGRGGSARRPRAAFTGAGATCRSRTRPTAPVAASTYHLPPSPSRMADLAGRLGGVLASNTRSCPASMRFPVADQRATPERSSSANASARSAVLTPVRAVSLPPSSFASDRTVSVPMESAMI